MKTLLTLSLFILLSYNSFSQAPPTSSPSAGSSKDEEEYYEPESDFVFMVDLVGVATNFSLNEAAGIKMALSKSNNGTYGLKGEFDNIHVIGNFDIKGKEIPSENSDLVLCLQFTGVLIAGGDDGSGLPENTKAPFVITLLLYHDAVKGVYHIGKVLPYTDFEQYGTLDLYFDED